MLTCLSLPPQRAAHQARFGGWETGTAGRSGPKLTRCRATTRHTPTPPQQFRPQQRLPRTRPRRCVYRAPGPRPAGPPGGLSQPRAEVSAPSHDSGPAIRDPALFPDRAGAWRLEWRRLLGRGGALSPLAAGAVPESEARARPFHGWRNREPGRECCPRHLNQRPGWEDRGLDGGCQTGTESHRNLEEK